AVETDVEGTAAAGGGARSGRRGGIPGFTSSRPTKIHEFVVYALNRQDGSVAWRRVVKKAVPHEGGHATASQASNSPITDGERIYAHFGSRGLHCLDATGKVLWSKDFGLMRTAMSFGEGSSPSLYGNTLVVVWDHEGDSFVAAFDKVSGKELWRTDRREGTSWSTPLITEVGGKAQAILTAAGASRGYDLQSGEEIWRCSGMTRNPIPSPIHVDGVAYLMSGFQGSTMQAIKLAGAKGNLRDSDNLLWTHRRGTSYVPSAMVYQGEIYFLRVSNGVLTCLDAKTGDVHYEGQRMRRMGTVYSSPVAAAGRIYFTSRRGYTKVIKAGEKYEELATNRLHDIIDGTPAIVDNEIYMRGEKHLYCIAEQK
ncbi:MAG: PQQ-binding-like beta-propeller repeat protein, partial [Planctomycetota bacterium]|nr:PQQ-binding-like beta-propeller repeat protein [Planctomycetota bacterium]